MSAIFSPNSFGHALLSPCVAFYLSRRSLQHIQEKVHLQLEYPPVFRAPVTGGVMFLTGDDTTMTVLLFFQLLLYCAIITRTVVLYCTDLCLYSNFLASTNFLYTRILRYKMKHLYLSRSCESEFYSGSTFSGHPWS